MRHLRFTTALAFNGTIPGPTIIISEGDVAIVRLINKTPTQVSIHAHGVHYDIKSDGTLHTGSFAPPDGEYVYKWTAGPGTAGTWHYHDHVAFGSEVEGIERGLYGALIVRSRGEPTPDKEFVLFMIEETFNGRQCPRAEPGPGCDTPLLSAKVGQRVRFHVISHGTSFHTFHLHGHRWVNPGTNRVVDTITVGPAETTVFDVIAGEAVGPGDWMYHCHVHSHIRDGMIGFLRVLP